MTRTPWQEWSDDAFALARAERKPVLLFLKASWCRWCKDLEERVLADPAVDELLAERFVCVRVDKDRRPDIDASYSKGGWPTLAYLDDAAELLASDTYLESDELLARLRLVADYYAENREAIRQQIEELEREAEEVPPAGPRRRQPPRLGLEIVDHVARTLLESSDPVHGGWGSQHKFPHPEAIDFALVRWSQTGDEAMRELVVRTLRHMQEGEIHDRVEGGFYRYATQPDWSVPHHEKMLDSNAQRLHAYLEAHQAFGEEGFAQTARGILAWMSETLLDPRTGAFRGSQDADPGYSHLGTRAARAEHGAPATDPTIFANWNAMAVSALLKASAVLDEPQHAEQALATLDFLVAELFDETRGMRHYWDGAARLPGMLSDQAYTLRALEDAAMYAGETRYLRTAKQLADLSIEQLHDPGGAFFDTRFDPEARGGLRQRNRSILENSVMAEALLRLGHVTRDADYADTARETLQAFVGDYKRYGHFVAGYARAVDLLHHEPVQVVIVGRRGARETRELAAAALRPYVASRIVQVLDPVDDADLLGGWGLPRPQEPARAFVFRGRESFKDTADPVKLPSYMTRL